MGQLPQRGSMTPRGRGSDGRCVEVWDCGEPMSTRPPVIEMLSPTACAPRGVHCTGSSGKVCRALQTGWPTAKPPLCGGWPSATVQTPAARTRATAPGSCAAAGCRPPPVRSLPTVTPRWSLANTSASLAQRKVKDTTLASRPLTESSMGTSPRPLSERGIFTLT